MTATDKIPFYAKTALVFTGIFFFVYTLYIGQFIMIPIVYAGLLAILLNPVVNYLVRKKINRIVAIFMAVILAIVTSGSILLVISTQISMFKTSYPQLKIKFAETSDQVVHWTSAKFKIPEEKIIEWSEGSQRDAINYFANGETLTRMGHISLFLVLLPVYLFLILFYKYLLLEFIRKLFRTEYHVTVAEILHSSKTIVQSYLVGLFLEMLIIAVLNSAGLLLLGIPYAIILGITGAILNIIPYIGGIIAIALPMIMAYVTKESNAYPLFVLGVYLCIQFIDNHYVVPYIVAKRVKINALISIIVVLVGGELWGIPGMFLSIPLTAIIKVIFDHIDTLKPWGFLLGNDDPPASGLISKKPKK